MEFVIIYIIIAIILSMLTKSFFFILFAIVSLVVFALLFINIWFLVIITKLFRTKSVKGRFLRVDTVKGAGEKINKFRYKVAVYSVDGKEYESVFPAEGIFGIYLYDSRAEYKLRLIEDENRVFDRFNLTSCITWPIFGINMLIIAAVLLAVLFKYRGYI
ncbi:MAG: hypothetical protein IJL89_05695 [Firmicutes bacterium]|nr:hypothetical protein [Bacillota bacterium]